MSTFSRTFGVSFSMGGEQPIYDNRIIEEDSFNYLIEEDSNKILIEED